MIEGKLVQASVNEEKLVRAGVSEENLVQPSVSMRGSYLHLEFLDCQAV